MKVIDNKYEIGDIVFLKTDQEQFERIVFALVVFKEEIVYKLAMGTVNSDHYEFEISKEKNYVPK